MMLEEVLQFISGSQIVPRSPANEINISVDFRLAEQGYIPLLPASTTCTRHLTLGLTASVEEMTSVWVKAFENAGPEFVVC